MTVHWPSHPRVPHPDQFLTTERRWNDIAAGWVARIFGSPWCIWAFLVVPLAILLAPQPWQSVVFYLASGWIQLFALPLLTYVGNKADQLRSAKAEADRVALSSMHEAMDALRADVTGIKGFLALTLAASSKPKDGV